MEKNNPTRVCKKCSVVFSDASFEIDFLSAAGLPLPDICPRCRFMRRLNERNARTLYY